MKKSMLLTFIISLLVLLGLFFMNPLSVKADECAHCIYQVVTPYGGSVAKPKKAQDVVIAYANEHVGQRNVPNVFTDLGLSVQPGYSCTETVQWWIYKVYGREAALQALGSPDFKYRAKLLADLPKVVEITNKDDVQPGDVGFTSGFSHTVFVVGVSGDKVQTVEGGPNKPFSNTRQKSNLSFYRWDWTPLQQIEDDKAFYTKVVDVIVKKQGEDSFRVDAKKCVSTKGSCSVSYDSDFIDSSYLKEQFFKGNRWSCPKNITISGGTNEAIITKGFSSKSKVSLLKSSHTNCQLKSNLKSLIKSQVNIQGEANGVNSNDSNDDKIVDVDPNDVIAFNNTQKIEVGEDNCKLLGNLRIYSKDFLFIIEVVGIILIVILSIIDFIKAVTTSSADGLKDAIKRMFRRIIVLALLFIVPKLCIWILDLAGIDTCYIN